MLLNVPFLGNTLEQWLVFLAFTIFGVVLGKIFLILSKSVFEKLAKKTKTKLDDIVVNIMKKPLPFILFIIVLFVDFGLDFLIINAGLLNVLDKIFFVLYVICGSWFVAKLVIGIIEEYMKRFSKKTDTRYDDELIPILRSLSQVIVIIIAISIILSYFGYNIGAIVAGLGIGGVAIALAAKPAIENLISGVVLFGEKDFNIGDVVEIDNEFGSIKEIGLRSTKVRKFDGTLLIMPNSEIVNNKIENISFRKNRRQDITLGLIYDTSSAKLKKAKKILQNILKKNRSVDSDFYIRFEEFDSSSLNIKVTFYITELDWGKYLKTKDQINMEIKEKFEKANLDFAFPTQTINLKK